MYGELGLPTSDKHSRAARCRDSPVSRCVDW